MIPSSNVEKLNNILNLDNFYFVDSIWQDDGDRTRDTASKNKEGWFSNCDQSMDEMQTKKLKHI